MSDSGLSDGMLSAVIAAGMDPSIPIDKMDVVDLIEKLTHRCAYNFPTNGKIHILSLFLSR